MFYKMTYAWTDEGETHPSRQLTMTKLVPDVNYQMMKPDPHGNQ